MRQGGSYKVEGKGKPKLVARTEPHSRPRARDADGKPLDGPDDRPAPKAATRPTPKKPAGTAPETKGEETVK